MLIWIGLFCLQIQSLLWIKCIYLIYYMCDIYIKVKIYFLYNITKLDGYKIFNYLFRWGLKENCHGLLKIGEKLKRTIMKCQCIVGVIFLFPVTLHKQSRLSHGKLYLSKFRKIPKINLHTKLYNYFPYKYKIGWFIK